MTRPLPTAAARLLLALALVLGLLAAAAPTRADDDAEPVAADTTPPSLAKPADLLVAAVGASGAAVGYDLPQAADETDRAVDVVCDPASGSLFSIGATTVNCFGRDDAGNEGSTSFLVTVADMTIPVILSPGDIFAGGNPVVSYGVTASDNVDSVVAVSCTMPSGSVFPVGTTTVTCNAADSVGNSAAPVSFMVVVDPPPPTATPVPAATDVPTATDVPAATKTPRPDATTAPTDVPTDVATAVPTDEPASRDATSTPRPTKTPRATGTPEPTSTPTATVVPTATRVSTPPALALAGPPPESFTLVGDGGPLGVLTMIWENGDYPITQEFGHTWFSVRHGGWYAYGRGYGLDGFEHTGLDIGMPRGTALHSPVSGTVMVAGGTPYFTFYGNGQPGVGELLIETDDGDEVVLGHMGLITVQVGQRVEFGQFVGLSGGDNGDHLHLETRDAQPGGGLRIVDPRGSFLAAAIAEADAAANRDAARPKAIASSRRSDDDRPGPGDAPEETPVPGPAATAEDPTAAR